VTTWNPKWSTEYVAYNQLKRLVTQPADATPTEGARADSLAAPRPTQPRLSCLADRHWLWLRRAVYGAGEETAAPLSDEDREALFRKRLLDEIDKVDAFYNAQLRASSTTFNFLDETVRGAPPPAP